MTTFSGKQKANTANAVTGTLSGFTGGNVTLLQDTIGDLFNAAGGNDTVIAGSGNDTINGGKGNDSLNGSAGNDSINGDAGSDRLRGGAGTDTINAGANDDTILVFQGEELDRIDGGTGIDTLDLSGLTTGEATVNLASGSLLVSGIAGSGTLSNLEHVTGGGADDSISGNSSNNSLAGGGGNDTLAGSGGADTLNGGAGNDRLTGGAGIDSLSGGAGNDTIVIIDGEAGDTVAGGADGDMLDFSDVTSAVNVSLAAGTWSTAASATSGTLSGIEDVRGGAAADRLTGDGVANVLSGLSGNDTLRGAGGLDTVNGGGGNDTFIVNEGEAGDTINGGDGEDTLNLSGLTTDTAVVNLGTGAWSTSANAASLDISAVENVTGGDAADRLTGDVNANSLVGGAGNDTLNGGAGLDTVSGGDGNDVIVINTGDLVAGEALDGGAGTDVLLLGTEAAAAVAYDFRSFTLTDIEGLNFSEFADVAKSARLNAAQASALTRIDGNLGAADRVVVNAGTAATTDLSAIIYSDWSTAASEGDRLTISGGAVNNVIIGSSLRDLISGGGGADTLTGGGGKDLLKGGAGNDVYIVNKAGEAVEALNKGIDAVRSTVSYTLGANIENLALLGTANLKGNGNALANKLTGNAGNNLLDGKKGADTLTGGLGNDTYIYGAGDKIVEASGGGIDTVKSSINVRLAANVEKVILTGSSAVSAIGNAGANTLTGNGAANTLNGMGGKDLLVGGAGADKFVFSTALNATKNVDVIQGFQINIDEIRLENAIFKTLAAGNLAAGAFKKGAAAGDASDRIIYESSTGKLFYDADGNGAGAQVQFAKLAAGLALDAGDFFVI